MGTTLASLTADVGQDISAILKTSTANVSAAQKLSVELLRSIFTHLLFDRNKIEDRLCQMHLAPEQAKKMLFYVMQLGLV
jgi:hypothetical protein